MCYRKGLVRGNLYLSPGSCNTASADAGGFYLDKSRATSHSPSEDNPLLPSRLTGRFAEALSLSFVFRVWFLSIYTWLQKIRGSPFSDLIPTFSLFYPPGLRILRKSILLRAVLSDESGTATGARDERPGRCQSCRKTVLQHLFQSTTNSPVKVVSG